MRALRWSGVSFAIFSDSSMRVVSVVELSTRESWLALPSPIEPKLLDGSIGFTRPGRVLRL